MRKETWPFDNIPSLFTTKATRLGVKPLLFYRFYSLFVSYLLCFLFRVNVILVVRCENENSQITKTRYTDLYVWSASRNMNMKTVV